MSDEIELKFQVPAKALAAVKRLKWISPSGPVKRQKLRSVYFDTPDQKLRAQGLFLRVRHIGRKRLQTLKAAGDAPFARHEWECEIDGTIPDLSRLKKTPLGPIKQSALKPMFETGVTRTAIPLQFAGSAIELALDKGEIRCAGRREPICEIEIELKAGDPAAIVKFAARLARSVPLRYAVNAKSMRGFALYDGTPGVESHAGAIPLKRKTSVGEAFRTIGLECLRQVVANEAAVRSANSEGVHQMRIGLRRLRAAMSIFKPLLADRESRAVKRELKWLTGQLGAARDFDVFVHESLAPIKTAAVEVKVLRRDMEAKRAVGFVHARQAVDGERYRKMVLKILFWLMAGDWSTRGDALALRARLVSALAAEVLEQRTRKIIKRTRKVAHLEPLKRHKLRIAVKKLRYATEFFAALFGGAKKRKAVLADVLETLQAALGRLNDFTVHRRMAGEIVGKSSAKRPQAAFAMGIVTGQEQGEIKVCLDGARKAGAALKSQRPFW